MSFISDLLVEISSFRIRIGNKLNALKTLIDGKAEIDGSNIPAGTFWNTLKAGGVGNYIYVDAQENDFTRVMVWDQGGWFWTNKSGFTSWLGLSYVNKGSASNGSLPNEILDLNAPPLGTYMAYTRSTSSNLPISGGGFLKNMYFVSSGLDYISQDWTSLNSNRFFKRSKTSLDFVELYHTGNFDPLQIPNNYLESIITTNGTTAGTVYTFKRVGLSDLTLQLTAASASFSGVVTTGAQTFSGNKTASDIWSFTNRVAIGNNPVGNEPLTVGSTTSNILARFSFDVAGGIA